MANDYVSGEGLEPSEENPFVPALLKNRAIGTRAKIVKGKAGWATKSAALVDPETGEMLGDTLCLAHKTAVDKEHFVKVYVEGLRATFDLSKRARSAFTLLLEEYNDTARPVLRNDMVIFSFKLARDRGWTTSQAAFRSAMNELCHKKFLCPVTGSTDWYWTNPTFFHKGDRLVIVNHYVFDEPRRPAAGDAVLDQLDFNGETERDRRNKP